MSGVNPHLTTLLTTERNRRRSWLRFNNCFMKSQEQAQAAGNDPIPKFPLDSPNIDMFVFCLVFGGRVNNIVTNGK